MSDQSLNQAEVLAEIKNSSGRPQTLDETKRRKVLALLANASSRRAAVRYFTSALKPSRGILSVLNVPCVFRKNNLRILSRLCKRAYPRPQRVDSIFHECVCRERTETTPSKHPIFFDSFPARTGGETAREAFSLRTILPRNSTAYERKEKAPADTSSASSDGETGGN
jgi:hypothetical protein